MTFLQQILDVLIEIVLGHFLGGVVIADDRPAVPLLQGLKRLFCAHLFPCQQAYEVSQEQLHVLAGEATRGLVVAFVFGVIEQGVHRQIDAHVFTDQRPDGLKIARAAEQFELAQAIAPKAVQMPSEGWQRSWYR